jgi:hypothetical protein
MTSEVQVSLPPLERLKDSPPCPWQESERGCGLGAGAGEGDKAHLSVSESQDINETGAAALAPELRKLTGLTSLKMDGNPIGDAGTVDPSPSAPKADGTYLPENGRLSCRGCGHGSPSPSSAPYPPWTWGPII